MKCSSFSFLFVSHDYKPFLLDESALYTHAGTEIRDMTIVSRICTMYVQHILTPTTFLALVSDFDLLVLLPPSLTSCIFVLYLNHFQFQCGISNYNNGQFPSKLCNFSNTVKNVVSLRTFLINYTIYMYTIFKCSPHIL